MKKRYILFVEDERLQREMFDDALKRWNSRNTEQGRRFEACIAETREEAEEALEKGRFDAAMFDLRVRSSGDRGAASPAGNALARTALREYGIPIAVMSADTSVLDDDLRGIDQLGTFDKNREPDEHGDAYDHAMMWFGDMWTMMCVLSAARHQIDRSAADIFTRRLWPRWADIAALQAGEAGSVEAIVTRQYMTHIADHLGNEEAGGATWHPFENYISPALLEHRAQTGDIFRLDEALWIVLTPQCDMATKKVETAVLARCAPGINKWHQNVEAIRLAESDDGRKAPAEFLRRYVNQNVGPSQHFLPPLPGEPEPLLVQFGDLMTLPLKQLNEQRLDQRVASIASPFLANLVQRFGAYVSRMGQPNIDVSRF
jgi:CheY-like chemotaxis protein